VTIAVAGPFFGWAVERYQAARNEGVASTADIVATALPFFAVAVLAGLVQWVA
jgi:hypothetical protein